MSTNTAFGAPPVYDPFDGSPEETLAKLRLFQWIEEQFTSGAVAAKVGDYILGTEGRIIGVGPDLEELHRQFVEPHPDLQNVRMLAYFVPEMGY